MHNAFAEIALILVLAAGLGMVARALRQPAIIGYIATGLIAGPFGFLKLNNPETLAAFSQIGITFLLFLVGLDMRFDELKQVGKAAVLTGLGQIAFTSAAGYGICRLLGFASLPSLYIAVGLTFSSTIIVIKLLSEKRDLDSLYGKIVVGFLLIQDFVALGFLILLSSLKGTAVHSLADLPWLAVGFTFVKATVLLAVVLAVGRWIMPRFLHVAGRSPELLLIASLAWGMGLAALVARPEIGLTVEIGAFMAGVAMSGSMEHSQISSRVRSLRDFFLVMFFVVLGSEMAFSQVALVWQPAIWLTLFVLVGNPLIVMCIMGALGYRARTSFLAAVTVAQVSEFSLILMTLGAKLGHVDQTAVSLVTVVALATITLSSYLIIYADEIYHALQEPLKFFEFRKASREDAPVNHEMHEHILLIGCHRLGHNILNALEGMHKDFLVVDFNPDVVTRLTRRGIRAIYGDISDPEIRDLSGLHTARLVVSTVPDVHESLSLMRHLKRTNPAAKAIMTGSSEDDAMHLYEAGADYVLLPHFIGGLQLAKLIESEGGVASLARLKEQDLALMTQHP